MNQDDERLLIGGQLLAVDYLATRVQAAALGPLRALLRDAGRWSAASPTQRVAIAGLLDAICRRLGATDADCMEYFEAVGDLLPRAPDDPAGLDE